MKKIALLLTLFAVTVNLTGCKKSELDENREKYKEFYNVDLNKNDVPDWQENDITLTFAVSHYQGNDNTFRLTAEKFTEKYPNIKIEFTDPSYTDLETLTALAIEGNMPDVFQVGDPAATNARNLLLDISPYVLTDNDYQYISDSIKEAMKNDNGSEIISIPWAHTFQLTIVNVSMLERYGIEAPSKEWTYDEYQELRNQILAKSQAGECVFPGTIDFSVNGPAYFDGIPNGYKGFNSETKQFELENATEYGKWLQSIALESKQGLDFPTLTDEQKQQKCQGVTDPWNEGKMAVKTEYFYSYEWVIKNLKEVNDDNYVIYPMPQAPEGGNTVGYTYTDHFGVSRSLSKDPVKAEAAAEFLKWITMSTEGLLSKYDIYYNNLVTPLSEEDHRTAATSGNDYHHGWPINNNPEVLAAHPVIKGFDHINVEDLIAKIDESLFEANEVESIKLALRNLDIISQDTFKLEYYQKQIAGAQPYVRWIPGFKAAADSLDPWKEIRDRMRDEAIPYESLAQDLDEILAQRMADSVRNQ